MSKKKQKVVSVQLDEKTFSIKKYLWFFAIVVLVLFANTFGHDYNMDDSMVTNNHPLTSKGTSALGEIFTSPYYKDNMGYQYGYRPMVHASYAIEHEIFGQNPHTGHFINVLLMVAAVVLFFRLLYQWLGKDQITMICIATGIFAVHPLHTEVVASLKNRDELLAFIFTLLTAISITKFVDRKKWWHLLFAALYICIGLLSKKSVYPMAMVIPIALIVVRILEIKSLAIVSCSLVIPAAFIASELDFYNFVLMTCLPLMVIAIVYYINKMVVIQNYKLIDLFLTPICLFLTFLVIGLLGYLVDVKLLWLSLPMIAILTYKRFDYGILALVVLLSIVNGIGGDTHMTVKTMMSLAIFGFLGVLLVKRKVNYFLLFALIIACAHLLYISVNLSILLQLLGVILLIFTIQFPKWLHLIILICLVAVYSLFGSLTNPIFVVVALMFITLILINWFNYKLVVAAVMSLLSVFVLVLMPKDIEKNAVIDVDKGNVQLVKSGNNVLKEGRELLYVENTLVNNPTVEEKVATGFLTLATYFKLHVFPSELSFYYGYAKIKTVTFSHPMVWLSILVHLGLIIFGLFQIKRRPIIFLAVVWYLASILLFSNWIELVAGMVGERLAFAASGGFAILIASLCVWLFPSIDFKKMQTGTIVVIGIVGLLGIRTFVRNKDWKDTFTLMSHDIEHLQSSAQANNLYAMTLMAKVVTDRTLSNNEKENLSNQAIQHFDQSIKLWPKFYNATIDKGRVYLYKNDLDLAYKAFKEAIDIQPYNDFAYTLALETLEKRGDKSGYISLAKQFFERKQSEMAYVCIAKAASFEENLQKCIELTNEGLTKYPQSQYLLNNKQILDDFVQSKPTNIQ